MSLQLLHKSLEYINKNDGIVDEKRKRKVKKASILEEKDIVKNLDERFDFDVESYQLIKKKRNEVHKHEGDVSYIFSDKDAKNGYSLVEQYRDTKPINLESQNRKYLKYSKKHKVPEEAINAVIEPVLKQKRKKQKQLESRMNLRGTLYGEKKSKPKNESIFSEADFESISNLKSSVETKVKKIK